ncbi:DUF1684 domain-containing protein [Bosea sp. RAF48]|uniref:DUF1684 domain-containing protein n=1 Tax=Bosea sp. RAF48 TaxID=3237480 RepID=UPI003F90402E
MAEAFQEPGRLRSTTGSLQHFSSLHDWRRQVADLYATIRSMPGHEGWELWRSTRERLFREHVQSPLPPERRARFGGIDCFPYDPALRFDVGLQSVGPREAIDISLGEDEAVRLVPFALTDGLGAALGKELTLYWITGYGGGVFLPFGDLTNRDETYPAGRYLLDTIKSADLGTSGDGRLILDFNFAYFPSCAHSDAWVCPLSPAENRLPKAVRGGERNPLPTG